MTLRGILRTSRLALLSVVATMALLASGCVSTQNPKALQDVTTPRGGKIDPAVWTAVDAAQPNDRLRKSAMAYWLLPLQFSMRNFQIANDHSEARYQSFVWNDLGTFILLLPVRIRFEETFYNRETNEPIGERGIVLHPFYAKDWNKGATTEGVELKAKGVPLFFSDVKISDQRNEKGKIFGTKFRSTAVLWTLGPYYLRSVGTTPDGREQKVTVAMPLMLGGFLGSLVWLDLDARVTQDPATLAAHGPLFGLLGHVYIKEPQYRPLAEGEPEAEQRMAFSRRQVLTGYRTNRMVLGGLLWQDVQRKTVDGEVTDSRHGILWSAFGWGEKENKGKVRFLWIPIG